MSKHRVIVLLIVPTVLVMAGGCGDNPRDALPSTATDVHEYDWSDLFPGDSVYFLKAKITPQEFEAYRDELKLVPIPETMKEEILWGGYSSANKGNIEWWDPLPTMEGTFYDPATTGSHRIIMKYENGYVYYWDSVGF